MAFWGNRSRCAGRLLLLLLLVAVAVAVAVAVVAFGLGGVKERRFWFSVTHSLTRSLTPRLPTNERIRPLTIFSLLILRAPPAPAPRRPCQARGKFRSPPPDRSEARGAYYLGKRWQRKE